MKTFTIITPVYNGQDYIANCIEAIANADYDLSKIEHIVVDDGSTDNTKQICEQLSQKYSHVRFYSKNNGNWGSVINYVKHNKLAHGEYIVICDADDIMLKTCFKTVNEKNHDADIFVSGFYRWNGKKRKIKIIPYFFMFKKDLHKKDLWNYHSPIIVPQSGWINNSIFYSLPDLKEGVAYQDIVLFTNAFLKANYIRYTTKATALYWCIRPGNSMTTSASDQGLAKLVNNFYHYEQNGWINPFYFYVLGLKRIRKYLKKNNLKFDFKGAKINYTGFPFYVRPIMRLLNLIFVKKFIKK